MLLRGTPADRQAGGVKGSHDNTKAGLSLDMPSQPSHSQAFSSKNAQTVAQNNLDMCNQTSVECHHKSSKS